MRLGLALLSPGALVAAALLCCYAGWRLARPGALPVASERQWNGA